MSDDTTYTAAGDNHAEVLMPKLCELEDSLKKCGDPEAALESYITAWRGAGVHAMMMGEDVGVELRSYPSLDGVFRWAVMENQVRLVDACIGQGADVHHDHHWAISYAVALGLDELIALLATKGKADMLGAIKAWESDPINQAGKESLCTKLRELALQFPQPDASPEVVSFSHDQLELAI